MGICSAFIPRRLVERLARAFRRARGADAPYRYSFLEPSIDRVLPAVPKPGSRRGTGDARSSHEQEQIPHPSAGVEQAPREGQAEGPQDQTPSSAPGASDAC